MCKKGFMYDVTMKRITSGNVSKNGVMDSKYNYTKGLKLKYVCTNLNFVFFRKVNVKL